MWFKQLYFHSFFAVIFIVSIFSKIRCFDQTESEVNLKDLDKFLKDLNSSDPEKNIEKRFKNEINNLLDENHDQSCVHQKIKNHRIIELYTHGIKNFIIKLQNFENVNEVKLSSKYTNIIETIVSDKDSTMETIRNICRCENSDFSFLKFDRIVKEQMTNENLCKLNYLIENDIVEDRNYEFNIVETIECKEIKEMFENDINLMTKTYLNEYEHQEDDVIFGIYSDESAKCFQNLIENEKFIKRSLGLRQMLKFDLGESKNEKVIKDVAKAYYSFSHGSLNCLNEIIIPVNSEMSSSTTQKIILNCISIFIPCLILTLWPL